MADAGFVKDPSEIYNQDFYALYKQEAIGHLVVASALHTTLSFDTVLDIGCGPGLVIQHLMDFGHKVFGIDGSKYALEAAHPAIRRYMAHRNLVTEDIDYGLHDLIVCVEVAEHLDAEHADRLVDLVTKHARSNVFWTAAIPGQGGTDHVNEQPPEYWTEKFRDRGFVLDAETTIVLRNALSPLYRLGVVQWCAQQGTIFKRKGSPKWIRT